MFLPCKKPVWKDDLILPIDCCRQVAKRFVKIMASAFISENGLQLLRRPGFPFLNNKIMVVVGQEEGYLPSLRA